MIFPLSDMPIVPAALQFEYFRSVCTVPVSEHVWFDMVVVDAIVYFYFMRYLALAKLNRYFDKHVAIHNLESILKREPILGHRETGYNLLGWIHFQEGWIRRGIEYFRMSWAIRPHHNAAKLHMLKYIRDINSSL